MPVRCASAKPQHRQVAALRKSAPDPLVEMHPSTADRRGIRAGDWVSLETPLAASVRGRSSTPLSTPKSSSASMAGGGL